MSSCIRKFDGYAMPVRFTYRRDDQFTTVCGGLLTMLTFLLIVAYGLQQTIYLWIKPGYSEETTTTFADFASTSEKININTQQSTIAVQLLALRDDYDPETIARVQFYSTHRPSKEDELEYNFFNAARCKDIYADKMDDQFYQHEFSDQSWICPDTSSFEIYNNPFLFETGRNFYMVVNNCTVATATDADRNLTSYTDKTCAEPEEIAERISSVRLNYKIMSQNFNPDEYRTKGETTSVILNRFTSDLVEHFTQSIKYLITETQVQFFDSRFIDFSDFTFFFSPEKRKEGQYNIKVGTFEYIGTSFFSSDRQDQDEFGYFGVDFSQSE